MDKILFLPSDHGGGLGHVSRCIFLANIAKNMDYETAIILEKKHYELGIRERIKTYLFDTRPERIQKYQIRKPFKPQIKQITQVKKPPVFLEFNSLSYQVPRDGYVSEKIVNVRIKRIEKIIDHFKPNLLIGDTHFLTYLGRKHSIPVIQITRLAGYPPDPKFIWWKESPAELVQPNALAPFSRAINDYIGIDLKKPEDLLGGDRYIIPSCPELEPIQRKGIDTVYVGSLAKTDNNFKTIPFFEENSRDKKIYFTIGGGAARGQEDLFFNNTLKVFDKTEFKILVSTGRRISASKYNNKSKNVYFADWVHGPSAINQSDLVIFHGGYSTTIETIIQNKLAVVMPSHSEQEGNGQRLKILGIGEVLPIHDDKLNSLEFNWPFGDYKFLAGYNMHLEKQKVLEVVRNLFEKRPIIENISESLKRCSENNEFRTVFHF